MEEQRKKRKDTDQDDGPEEEEVILKVLGLFKVLKFMIRFPQERVWWDSQNYW